MFVTFVAGFMMKKLALQIKVSSQEQKSKICQKSSSVNFVVLAKNILEKKTKENFYV